MIYDLIKQALLEYDTTEPVLLPTHKHDEDTLDYVWCSSLGYCPWPTALKRMGVEPKFPLTDNEKVSDVIRFGQGNAAAEIYQKAMLQKFNDDKDFTGEDAVGLFWFDPEVLAETPLRSETLKLSGRADMIYRTGSDLHVIEIKRPHDGAGLEPKLQYGLQVLAYKMILEELYPQFTVHAHILISNFDIFRLWSLIDQSDGTRLGDTRWYQTYNENNEIWEDVRGVTQTIFDSDVYHERDRQLAYLQGKTDIPFPDFLNQRDQGSWQCFRYTNGKTPKKYKGEYKGETERVEQAKRSCPFFCHTNELEDGMYFSVRETEYNSNTFVPLFKDKEF